MGPSPNEPENKPQPGVRTPKSGREERSSSPRGRDETVAQDPAELAAALARSAGNVESLLGKEPAEPPPLKPPGYRMIRRLGAGAFGEVWLAREENKRIDVAIKFFLGRTGGWQLLRQEAKKLALLNADPRIIHLLAVDDTTEPPYLVMDFAEKGSLRDLLDNGPLALPVALGLFRQLVEAMAYVHAKGIRHCDLKPGNVLIAADGRPRIADFGQAMLSVEASSAALGTFFYMAPEQALAERQVADARWDVYALGAIFHKMITGEPPHFDARLRDRLEETADLSHRLQRYQQWMRESPPPTRHRKVRGIDPGLAKIIDRCLAVEPARRLRDAGDVLQALDDCERRRRTQPLRRFGLFAPLLVLVLMAVGYFLFDATLTDAGQRVRAQKQEADRLTAQVVADFVEEKLQRLCNDVERYSESEKLLEAVGPLFEAKTEREGSQALKAVNEKLGKYLNACDMAYSFAVLDALGTVRAERRRAEGSERVPRDESFRDYFNRGGDRFGEKGRFAYRPNTRSRPSRTEHTTPNPYDAAYLGQPFRDGPDGQDVFSVSAAIYRHPKTQEGRIGLLCAMVKLDDFDEWFRAIEESGGLRSGANSRAGRKDPTESDPMTVVLLDARGYCLHHRRELQHLYRPAPNKTPELHPVFQQLHAEAVKPENENQTRVIDGYDDPLDPERGKHYAAAVAPVDHFGWTVIVQHPTTIMQQRIDEIRSTFLRWTLLGGAAGAVLLASFWGWLLWVLFRKEKLDHA